MREVVGSEWRNVDVIRMCEACDGKGEVPSGMCMCGEYIKDGVCDNHTSVEMNERCEDCEGTGAHKPTTIEDLAGKPTTAVRQQWNEHVLITLGDVKLYVVNRPDEYGHVVVKRGDNIVGVVEPTDPTMLLYRAPLQDEEREKIQVGIDEEFDE
jgi:DnaJ-class molecular chaperone